MFIVVDRSFRLLQDECLLLLSTVWRWQVENDQDNTHVTSQKRSATVQNCKRRFLESIEWFIKGRLSRCRMIWLLPHLPSADCLSLLVFLCVADCSTDGGGGGGGCIITSARKPGFSLVLYKSSNALFSPPKSTGNLKALPSKLWTPAWPIYVICTVCACVGLFIFLMKRKKILQNLNWCRGLILEAAMGARNRVGTSRNNPLPTKPQF
jgi:hypothetical protein